MCKKLVFAPASVPCSLYLFNVMVAHRESPRQVVELHSRTMAPLLHQWPSLAFRWLFIQPARTGRHKRITLARISVGSGMKCHTNRSWPLFVIMIWRAMQRNESRDSNDRMDLFVPFFFEFVSRAHVTTTKWRSRYGHLIYDSFVQRLPTGVLCRGFGEWGGIRTLTSDLQDLAQPCTTLHNLVQVLGKSAGNLHHHHDFLASPRLFAAFSSNHYTGGHHL
jgi:hypothetical protein